jgi:hypothetical protein
MTDLTKLKRRSSLGAPPSPAEASPNLEAPETAPPPAAPVRRMAVVPAAASRVGEGSRAMTAAAPGVRDATRVSPEFDNRLRSIAECDGKLLVEVLEEALKAYENSLPRQAIR